MGNYVQWKDWDLSDEEMVSLSCQRAIGKIKSSYFRQGLRLQDCIIDNNVPKPIRDELNALRKIWHNGLHTHDYIDTKKVVKKRKKGNITEIKQIEKTMEYQHQSETFGHAYAILLQMKTFNVPMDGIFTGMFEKMFNRIALAQFKTKYGRLQTIKQKDGTQYQTYKYTTGELTQANLDALKAYENEYHMSEGEIDKNILLKRCRKVLSDREIKVWCLYAEKYTQKEIAKMLNLSQPSVSDILKRIPDKIQPIVDRIKHIELTA